MRTYGWCIRGCERWRDEVCERRSDDGWRALGFLRRRLAFWRRDISLALDGTLLGNLHLWSKIIGRTRKLLWTRALVLRLDRLLEKLAPVNEMIAQCQLSRREPDWRIWNAVEPNMLARKLGQSRKQQLRSRTGENVFARNFDAVLGIESRQAGRVRDF
jgi:hypothetical protein